MFEALASHPAVKRLLPVIPKNGVAGASDADLDALLTVISEIWPQAATPKKPAFAVGQTWLNQSNEKFTIVATTGNANGPIIGQNRFGFVQEFCAEGHPRCFGEGEHQESGASDLVRLSDAPPLTDHAAPSRYPAVLVEAIARGDYETDRVLTHSTVAWDALTQKQQSVHTILAALLLDTAGALGLNQTEGA